MTRGATTPRLMLFADRGEAVTGHHAVRSVTVLAAVVALVVACGSETSVVSPGISAGRPSASGEPSAAASRPAVSESCVLVEALAEYGPAVDEFVLVLQRDYDAVEFAEAWHAMDQAKILVAEAREDEALSEGALGFSLDEPLIRSIEYLKQAAEALYRGDLDTASQITDTAQRLIARTNRQTADTRAECGDVGPLEAPLLMSVTRQSTSSPTGG